MKITDSVKVGKISLKSRVIMAPMATNQSTDGFVSEAVIEHYVQRAKNPLISLIVMEYSYVSRQGKAVPYQISAASDEVIPGLQKLANAVHEANDKIKIFGQINHAGFYTSSATTGQTLVSPSAFDNGREKSRTLTVQEIHKIEEDYASCAYRFKKAGFDGIEIHAAHAYLFNQFYSPLTNFRHDQYGIDTIKNRLRALLETIACVRKAVGPDYPVSVRFGGADFLPEGATIKDSVSAAAYLEAAGADLLNVSGGFCIFKRPGHDEPGYFGDMTSAIKQKVHIPVVLTGGIKTHEQAEKLLQEGAADIIGIGRALYRDPNW